MLCFVSWASKSKAAAAIKGYLSHLFPDFVQILHSVCFLTFEIKDHIGLFLVSQAFIVQFCSNLACKYHWPLKSNAKKALAAYLLYISHLLHVQLYILFTAYTLFTAIFVYFALYFIYTSIFYVPFNFVCKTTYWV